MVARTIRYAALGLTLAWVAVICWFIARTPAPGEDSPQALAAAYQHAIDNGNADAVARLAASPPDDPAGLQTLLTPPACGPQPITVAAAKDRLVLRSGGNECGWIPIVAADGRWLIDPWAEPVRR